MKKANVIFVLVLSLFLAITAIGCAPEEEKPSPKPGPDPSSTVNIGVLFGDDLEERELIEIDYKNALAGLLFFDKDSADEAPLALNLTALTVNNETVSAENYQYNSGILEFTETYLKNLTLDQNYAVTATFGDSSVSFSIKTTDAGAPAFQYLNELKDVYLLNSEITLPLASKSPSSIQNISANYALTDENGNAVSYSDNCFIANSVGKYTYTATFVKNENVYSSNEKEFVVIDLANANLADENCAVVLGGTYNEEEQASLFSGNQELKQITVDSSYKYVRICFKGEGTIAFGDDATALSSDHYATAWLTVSDFNKVKITSTNGLYIKSLELSKTSAFTKEDIETLDFSDNAFLSFWSYNADYGTPSFDNELGGISFDGTNNSWPYALREGIIKTAYDNGYRYLVITYTGKGTTRVFNNETGDWGGFSRDLSAATLKRLAYNLEEATKKAEIDESSGFSIITDSAALVLTEFRFYKTDVVIEEEGIYNTMNLVDASLTDKWSYNQGGSDAASYNESEQAMSFPANANYDTFNFEHDALRKAQKKGYNALAFTVKGSSGEISLFVDNNWGRNVKFTVNTNGEYVQGILFFGELIFNEKSGIAILSSNPKDGDPVLIKEMRFTNAEPEPELDYTKANLASEELIGDWYYNENSGVAPYYDGNESALVFPANGNYDTYTFSNQAVKEAKEKGYNAITFTVKGTNASIRVFKSGSWNSDALYKVNSSDEYTTFTMYFAHLDIGEQSGITLLVSDSIGGAALYVQQLKFEKITVDEKIVKLMTGNLVSQENTSLWTGNEKCTVSYDETNACMKFDYTAISDVRLNVSQIFEYAKLFGKTKIVWTRVADDKDNYGRLRLYENEEKFSEGKGSAVKSVNILGDKLPDESRVMEIDITEATETYIFIVGNQKGSDTCVRISELYFA